MKYLLLLSFLISCSHYQQLNIEKHINIEKFQGKWYAIAWIPQFFTRKCASQIAYYKLEHQILKVRNECENIEHQTIDYIDGEGVIKNKENSILEITFNNFFTKLLKVKGDYEIIKINPDYTIALVGSYNRSSLWILSKKSKISKDDIDKLLSIATNEGFDIKEMIVPKENIL